MHPLKITYTNPVMILQLFPKGSSLTSFLSSRIVLSLATAILCSLDLSAQIFDVPATGSGSSTACFGILRDPGGSGNYSAYADGYFVIDPPGNSAVSVVFTSFQTETFYDNVRIYDGSGTTGTLLGTYNGSSLPSNGNAILSTSGAITIRFQSNCCSHYPGFVMSWNTSASTLPNASFAVNTSPAYNTPVQFINTTTNGGSYLWEFGDGSTSTDVNPSHSYTTTGAKQARLIATNCAGSDTSTYKTINVQAAPAGSISTDTVTMTVACGTTNSGSFTISNSGSGTLSYALQLVQPTANTAFSEDFEGGTLGGFTNLNTNYTTATVQNTNAPQGVNYLEVSGYGYVDEGLKASFASSTPEHISYRVMDNSYASYHGYVRFGMYDNFNTFRDFFNSNFRYNDLRLYYRDVNNYTTYYSAPRTQGTWYQIELKNIDFTAQTYDIYLDGVAVVTGAHFVDNTVTGLSDIVVHHSSTGNIGIDDFQISANDLIGRITFNPKTGNLSNGSSNVIFLNADATGLNAGTYWLQFVLSSNDTALDGLIIPLKLEVTGTANLYQSATCLNYGTVFTGFAAQDSVLLSNSGCDTLDFTSITASHADISASQSSLQLAPGDSLYLGVSLNATAIGSFNDTLYLSGPDTNAFICITAQATGAPAVTTDSTAYTINYTGCNDSVSFPFVLYNTGQGNLNWSTSSGLNSTITDDFEGAALNANIWASSGFGVTQTSVCGTITGSKSLSFYGSSFREIITVPLNTTSGGTISFTLGQGTCELADFGEGINVEYSTNNGLTWNFIGYAYQASTFNNLNVSYPLPAAAQGTSVKFRLKQQSFNGSTYDSWLVDDFSISAGTNNTIVFSPDTSQVAPGDSVTIIGTIGIQGLNTGIHTFTAYIASNAPGNPVYSFPVMLNLTGLPNMVVPAACANLGQVINGNAGSDSVMIVNDGCGDLTINGTTLTSSDFSVSTPVTNIAPGDTAFVHLTFTPTALGSYSDTLYLNTNDTTGVICLTGTGLGAPQASLDTSAINVSITACNDSVLIQRTLYNNGQGSLTYKVKGRDGDLPLQAVLDTFKGGYTSVTGLIPSIYYFSEGVFGNYINDGGGDMYDGGNQLSTDFSFNFINYSDDLISSSSILGTNGEYFTHKGTGIWLFAADLDGVSSFDISGNLGADGFGQVSATILTSNIGGVSYTGYVKRVYNAGDPSVNHLVMVKSGTGIAHTYPTGTDYDTHSVTGLSSTSRLYYLLFAGSNGAFINDAAMQSIMDQFLGMAEGSGLPPWISVQPDSGAVAAPDSTVLDIWIKTTGLSSGVHNSQVTVATNDPANPSFTIPVQLTLTGAPEISAINNIGCLSFTNVQQGATATDSVWVYNSGCDTLDVTGFNASAEFGIANIPANLAPGDSAPLVVAFSPLTVGSFADTIQVLNNDTTLYICVSGTSIGAPVLLLPTDTLRVELNKCNVIKNENFRIANPGQGSLTYGISFGGYLNQSQIAYNTNNAVTTHSFNGVPASDTLELRIILHGDYDTYSERAYLTLDNSYYYGSIYDNGKSYVNDTIDLMYYGNLVQNWTSDGNFSVELDNTFDVDGGPGSFHRVEVKFSSQVNWVTIVGSSSGNIGVGAFANKNLLFNAASLGLGTYYTNMNITTNTPGNPNAVVPVELKVVSKPEIGISDTCLNYGLTLLGDTSTQDYWVYNRGCQVLNVSGMLATSGDFKVSPSNGNIPVGDSLLVTVKFIPTSIKNYAASILISNNDTVQIICLNGASDALPVAGFNFSYQNACLGQVAFSNSTQNTPTGFLWNFGDGNVSGQPDPLHSYAKPGTYRVLLRANNNAGFDTISQLVTVNPLYVNFSMTNDTVKLNTAVNFYDSSAAAPTSWAWDLGDGGSDLTQNPTHTYTALGTYQVSLEVGDSRSCKRTETKTIYVVDMIGLNEYLVDGQRYELFPNPSSGQVNLTATNLDWSRYELRIADATGKLVRVIKPRESSAEYSFDLSSVRAGMYQLMIVKDGLIKSRQSLIIH